MSESSFFPSSPIPLGNSIANYVELAALVLPERKLGIKERMRSACAFLPMPLSLGWDTDPGDEEAPPDSTIPGLMLSDMSSGATRLVTARWMHALYKHIVDTQNPGTIVMHLQEAGYTAHFGWAHIVICATFLLQFWSIIFAMTHGQRREGLLLLAAALLRILEGIFAWAYPKYRPPRSEETATARYCVLHTGMTTNHILVLTHRFGYRGRCINLEDAAAPLPCKAHGWQRKLQDGARGTLKIFAWLQKGASLVTAANGYAIPTVLLSGTLVLELVSASAEALPVNVITVLSTGNSVLDRLTAACQFTKSISVGFVETLLPDPRGHHIDYEWISEVMREQFPLDAHPTHPMANAVLESTLRRRRPQIVPPTPAPVYPPSAVARN
ncbi:hypothetical protein C8F04DRAFT_573759 [Mycena alexandri]|uniref:Uncharacterized protein n=1 Tax=Mycena alexandri TaxID=1745969 RepID=A0AAD6X4E4_9AGAR|nr:hypothetical protein C8F04DRAFT_573759 [Mycena alexandri]